MKVVILAGGFGTRKSEESLYNCMMSNNAEIVCGRVNKVYENGRPLEICRPSHNIFVFNQEETVNELCLQTRFRFEVWNKLIRKEQINNTRFPDNQRYEDIKI